VSNTQSARYLELAGAGAMMASFNEVTQAMGQIIVVQAGPVTRPLFSSN